MKFIPYTVAAVNLDGCLGRFEFEGIEAGKFAFTCETEYLSLKDLEDLVKQMKKLNEELK